MASDKKSEQPSYSEWVTPLFNAWKDRGLFSRTPGFGKNGADTYTIVIPPPRLPVCFIWVMLLMTLFKTPVFVVPVCRVIKLVGL